MRPDLHVDVQVAGATAGASRVAELGDPQPRATNGLAPQLEAWRSATGKQPRFWERVRTRYPRLLPIFARGAALTVGLSVSSMALAIFLGIALALGRTYGPRGVR